jgi:hypothetical protein
MKKIIFTSLLSVLSFGFLFSQESVVEFQFINTAYLCDANQVCFEVQVRAITPNQGDGTIELADVNYRFFYPESIMSFASATGLVSGYFQPSIDTDTGILGEEVLDLFGDAFDGADGLGWVDYSIQVDGNGNAVTLTSDWLSTTEVCFTPADPLVQDQDFCTQIIWSLPAYNGTTNYYKFAYITATEVVDGGGSGISELTEEVIHYGWSEDDMDILNGCEIVECTVLPIELTEFKAELIAENEAQLDWITASEINSDYFEIERRSDREERFITIGTEAAAGSSFRSLDYQYLDRLPESGSKFYYRLRMVDKDGTFTYSATRVVARDGESKSRLAVFPNPTTRYANVDFFVNGNNKEVEITIFDNTGKAAMQTIQRDNLSEGNYLERFDLKDLSSGAYIIQVILDGKLEVLPLQVIK